MEASDALKSIFYGEGTNVGTTASRVPLLDASGNPIGSCTMDKLMSLVNQAISAT